MSTAREKGHRARLIHPKGINLDRDGVIRLFTQHAQALGASSILKVRGVPYTYSVTILDPSKNVLWTHTALILVHSSDYWTLRVHLQRHDLALLVVWEHDSIVPLPVLAINSGHWHSAKTHTKRRTSRNRYTAKLFLGELLCGMQSAYDELEKIPYQTKHRYLKQVHALMHRTKGRPIVV